VGFGNKNRKKACGRRTTEPYRAARPDPSRAEHEELTRLYIIVFFLPTESPFGLNPSELEESLAAWRYRFQRHLCQWRSFFQLRRYLGDAEYDSTFLIGHLLYIYLANIWSSHIIQNFLEIHILIGEKRKKNYPQLPL
jgi:hypothetical protein